jgi:hypothetical protein
VKSFESREEETTTVYEKPRKTFEFSVDSKSERFKDSKVLDTARSNSDFGISKLHRNLSQFNQL